MLISRLQNCKILRPELSEVGLELAQDSSHRDQPFKQQPCLILFCFQINNVFRQNSVLPDALKPIKLVEQLPRVFFFVFRKALRF